MTPKEDLFKLVKSLSRSEKRYFTLDAQKSGAKNSNYLNLFKEINRMAKYDESNLKGDFPNLSMDKAYLYEAILKSMRDYRSPKSKSAQLKQHIIDSKFLYERGLFDQVAHRLKAAKTIAQELSDSLSLIEINREERRLAKAGGISKFNLRFDDFKAVKDKQIKDLSDEFHYFDIYDYLFSEITTKFIYTKDEDRKDLQIRFNPSNWVEPDNAQSKLRFFQTKALYYHLLGKTNISGEYFQKTALLWDENPRIKKDEFYRYIIDLSNALAVSFYNKEMETVKILLQTLRNQKTDNFNEENLKFVNITTHELNYVLETKEFKEVNYLEKEVESGIKKYDIPISNKLTLFFQTAAMMMGASDLSASKKWLAAIISHKNYKDRQDIQKAARILSLLLTAETEDYEVVELLIRSYDRFFKKSFGREEIKFELKFISFFKSIIPFPLDKDEREAFTEYYDEISKTNQGNVSFLAIKAWKEWRELNQK